MSPADPVRPSLRFGLPALVGALALALWIPSWTGEFLNYDDDHNFTGNLSYRGLGPENLRWMFTSHYGHYVPVTWLTHGLDYVLFGMNPTGYRVVNSLYHALNAVLVFLLFLSLIRSARPDLEDLRARGAAAAGALFFALHPLRAASVAWITERRDMVSGMFFLLTILTYLRWISLPAGPARLRGLVLSCFCFALMLLSKTLGMTVPFVLLILDVWPLRRYPAVPLRALLVEKIPYFALMFGGLALTSLTQGTADTIYTRAQYPFSESLGQPGFRVLFYIAKTVAPINLSPLYFYRPGIGLPQILGWLVLLAATALLIVRRRRVPALLAAWLSYGLLIAPVSGLVQAGPHYAQDSWTYVTCLPFAALFGALLLLPARPLPAAAAAALIALSILTVRQSLIWKNSVALWEAAIRIEPDVYYSQHQLGRAKAERGDLDGAIAAFSRSIELRSGFPEAWHERGIAWARNHRHDLALKDFAIAMQLDPKRPETPHYLGLTLLKLGKRTEALAYFSRAIDLRPEFPDARIQRARLRALLGDPKAALADITVALRLRPSAANHLERAAILAMSGDPMSAIADCTEAIRLQPDHPEAYVRRGVARLEAGLKGPAAEDFTRALQLARPDWPQRPMVEQFLRKATGQE